MWGVFIRTIKFFKFSKVTFCGLWAKCRNSLGSPSLDGEGAEGGWGDMEASEYQKLLL